MAFFCDNGLMAVEIEGVKLHLAHPDEIPVRWVGQEEVMRQLLAAWLVVDAKDLPMNPRLIGKPGVGKTTLAYAAAKRLFDQLFPHRKPPIIVGRLDASDQSDRSDQSDKSESSHAARGTRHASPN